MVLDVFQCDLSLICVGFERFYMNCDFFLLLYVWVLSDFSRFLIVSQLVSQLVS